MTKISAKGFKVALLLGVGLTAAGCGSGVASGYVTPSGVYSSPPKGPNPASFLSYNAVKKTATVTIDADEDNENGGFDFDGYSFGHMKILIPENYRVTVKFTNDGSMSHSVAVVDAGAKAPTKPVIPGASTPRPTYGTQPGSSAIFHFTTPSKPTRYELACLVPGHIALGMYIDLDVVSAPVPSAARNK